MSWNGRSQARQGLRPAEAVGLYPRTFNGEPLKVINQRMRWAEVAGGAGNWLLHLRTSCVFPNLPIFLRTRA